MNITLLVLIVGFAYCFYELRDIKKILEEKQCHKNDDDDLPEELK